MAQEILNKLLDFIAQNFSVELDEINLEKSLVDEGIIDSIGFIEITSYLSKEFSVEVQEDQINRENFGSVMKIVNFIEREIRKPSVRKSF